MLATEGRAVMMEREDSFTIGGKRFSYGSMAVFEVGLDGQINQWREYYDLKSITDQIEAAGLGTPS